LALKWSKSLEKRTDFAGKSVVIFFHLELKTIRVEVKAILGYIVEIDNEVIGISATELETNILPQVENKAQQINGKNNGKKNEHRQRYSNPQSWIPSYVSAYALSRVYSQQCVVPIVPIVPIVPQIGNKNQFQGRKNFYKSSNQKSS
jgi:hypothetical protein